MKTIDYERWVSTADETLERSRYILEHFDVERLKRRKRAPGRARPSARRPPRGK